MAEKCRPSGKGEGRNENQGGSAAVALVSNAGDPTKEDRRSFGRKRRGGQVLQNKNDTSTNMVELVAEEIRGIIYYVDTSQRVYNIEDILDEKVDPRVIGKLITTETGQKEFCYTAPGPDSGAAAAGTL